MSKKHSSWKMKFLRANLYQFYIFWYYIFRFVQASMVLNVENCMNFSSKQELEAFKLHIEEIIKLISYKNFTGREKSSEAMYIDVIKASLYIIQICIALFGNSLIIAVICFNRFLWKPTNYYILNLAICDLAIVLSCMWVQIVIGFNENWVLGNIINLKTILKMKIVIKIHKINFKVKRFVN